MIARKWTGATGLSEDLATELDRFAITFPEDATIQGLHTAKLFFEATHDSVYQIQNSECTPANYRRLASTEQGRRPYHLSARRLPVLRGRHLRGPE